LISYDAIEILFTELWRYSVAACCTPPPNTAYKLACHITGNP